MSRYESTTALGSRPAMSSSSDPAHRYSLNSKRATGSGYNEQISYFDESTRTEVAPAHRTDDPSLVACEPNMLCFKGWWKKYRDANIINKKGVMSWLINEKRWILTGILLTVSEEHRQFNINKSDWMAQDMGTFNEEIMLEFYASYPSTL